MSDNMIDNMGDNMNVNMNADVNMNVSVNTKTYMDTSLTPEARARLLLKEMGVEEKMGQLVGYIPQELGKYEQLDQDYPQGAGQVSCLQMRALDTLEDAARLQREVQEKIMAMSDHHIPAIFHMEGLCGAYIKGAQSFPSGIGRASTWDPELEASVGQIVGRQERAVGITHTFAPVLDISRDSRMGRQGETYGEDPALAAAMGSAFTSGVQQKRCDGLGTEAVAKHFLGFHAGAAGIHGADCEISERTLQEVYAKPFQAAITQSDLKGIMPCYCSINGEPVSASEYIMTTLLRDRMGFDGVTVSDYCAVNNIYQVQKVCESYEEAGLRAMEAGMDMELHFKKCYNDQLGEWFSQGKADMAILDRAVLRVLTAKFRMGLFEHPFALEGDGLCQEFYGDQKADEAIAFKAAGESLILLKNDGALPVKDDVRRIAVIGAQADTARIMYGGYTHFSMAEGMLAAIKTMAGLQTEKDETVAPMETIPGTPIQKDGPEFEALLKKMDPDAKSLLEAVRERFSDRQVVYVPGYDFAGNDMSGHQAALEAAKNADLVILMLGGKHGTSSIASMGEGIDAVDINLPLCQEAFLEKLMVLKAEENWDKPVVGIHLNGRPISSDGADRCCNALIEAWNPAKMGAPAIAAALAGDLNPAGRLPLSVARCAGQIPVYYNHPNGSSFHQGESIAFSNYVDMPHTPRYYFGHGLSYTTFEYSRLTLDKDSGAPFDTVTVSVDVENTGSRDGDEVVQLYIKDVHASMTRPVMELAGFKRIHLGVGEKKTVEFKLDVSQTAFLDRNMRWKVEKGEIDVMVGASSQDLRLRDSFYIREDGWVDGRHRGFYARVNVK